MRRATICLSVAVLMLFGPVLPASADVENTEAANTQEGDNSGSADSSGSSQGGDAVGGQVVGVVSSGDTSVDAKNRSEKADLASGEVAGSNSAAGFVGLNVSTSTQENVVIDDATVGTGFNVQDGDNELSSEQTVTASSGDAVGGQVIGAVTSAGGSADIVADNGSKDVDVQTGDAEATNASDDFVGQDFFSFTTSTVFDIDVSAGEAGNVQEGDNELSSQQTADVSSGDGVAGQVIGAVSAGDTSIDARNRSEDVDLETGEASATNVGEGFVGLDFFAFSSSTELTDAGAETAANVQTGDNSLDRSQASGATTGDGVAGQVIGAVTSAGGSADIVADNASKDVDIETGAARASNDSADTVGLDSSSVSQSRECLAIFIFFFCSSDAEANQTNNIQDGDNDLASDQSVSAETGDGVAGQVIGAVSAGDTSIDARNRSEDVDLQTGEASASNVATAFVGQRFLEFSSSTDIFAVTDAVAGTANNVQDGDNSLDRSQAADASSGDAVGGQVVGAVTAAGGSADIVADNASKKVEVETGAAEAANAADEFVGQDFLAFNSSTVVTVFSIDAVAGRASNIQDGDNELSSDQTASAATGDGVAGQVTGAVSAGDTSIDARNRSEKVELETGEASAANDAIAFVGQQVQEFNETLELNFIGLDADADTAANQQDGDNEAALEQVAEATSGDAVAGQVVGAVTSAGGSADVVLDNASKKVDLDSGDGSFANSRDLFVGLRFATETFTVLGVPG